MTRGNSLRGLTPRSNSAFERTAGNDWLIMAEGIPEFGAAVPGADYVLRPGGYLVVRNSRDEIAVLSTPQGFVLPGGGQDSGESPAQAAVREADEECGMHVRLKGLLGTADELVFAASEATYFRKRCVFFSAELVRRGEGGESDHHLMWMTAEDAAARLRHESQAWAVMEATRLFGDANTVSVEIRPVGVEHRPWVSRAVSETFASPRIVSRGVLHMATDLPGFLAEQHGTPIGLLLYDMGARECEVVVLLSLQERTGVATHLLARAEQLAREAGCRRLWLVTTNDNLSAIAFYQARGWRQVAVRRGAVAEARWLKPEIPEFGANGLPKEDEIEFELALGDPPPNHGMQPTASGRG